MKSSPASQTPANPSFDRMTLKGYVPTTRNALKGSHWSVLFREKKRAAHALLSALRSLADAPVTGTTTTSKSFKTHLSMLESWMATSGMFSKAASDPKRHTRRTKKEPR